MKQEDCHCIYATRSWAILDLLVNPTFLGAVEMEDHDGSVERVRQLMRGQHGPPPGNPWEVQSGLGDRAHLDSRWPQATPGQSVYTSPTASENPCDHVQVISGYCKWFSYLVTFLVSIHTATNAFCNSSCTQQKMEGILFPLEQ